MERDKALSIVKPHLTEKRYIHTIGVMETAVDLAKKYGYDEKKAELAAIFHDYAKYRPENEMKSIIIEQKMPKELLDFHPELWHAPVGSYLVKTEVGIEDVDILNAIAYHTTGRPNMTLLEKIIFIADYIEPNRNFPGVEQVRDLVKTNLDGAILQSLKNTIIYLTKKNATIYPDTLYTYNYFIKMKEE